MTLAIGAGGITLSVHAQDKPEKVEKAADDAKDTKFAYVDLTEKGNHKLEQDMNDPAGNNLKNVPTGERTFGDAKYKIGEKLIRVKGTNVPTLPEKIEGIKVNGKATTVYFLHATEYGEPDTADGTEIGNYIVHYDDKTEEKIPIKYGEDVRDWWRNDERATLKKAKIVWTGTNAAASESNKKIQLYATAWKNPHPDKTITTLDVVSKNTECDPFVVAVSLGSK